MGRSKGPLWAWSPAVAAVWTFTILFGAILQRLFGVELGHADVAWTLVVPLLLVLLCAPFALFYVPPLLIARRVAKRACSLPRGAVGAARNCMIFIGAVQLVAGVLTVSIAAGGGPWTLTAVGAGDAALLLFAGALRDVARSRWLARVGGRARVELIVDRVAEVPALTALDDGELQYVLVARERTREGPYRSTVRRRPLLRLAGDPEDVRRRLHRGAALQIELAVLLATLSAVATLWQS